MRIFFDMRVGDLVSWIPDYITSERPFPTMWLGIVVRGERLNKRGYVKVQWYTNQEGYYDADWTSIQHLRIISEA